MRALSVPSSGACPRIYGGASGLLKARGPAQRFSGATSPPFASCLGRRGAASGQDVLMQTDLITEPTAAPQHSSVPPISGRGMPPVVLCLAPAESSSSGGLGSSSSVSLADPPSASSLSPMAFPGATGIAPPAPSPLVLPPTTATPPAPDMAAVAAAAASQGPQVDSRGYVKEMMNLSVELVDSVEEDSKTKELDPNSYTTGNAAAVAPAATEVSPERIEAQELLRSFDPAAHVGERHNWMIVLAPETPVAGEECIVMFNRQQSDALRARPRVQLSYGFNQWQLNDKGNNFVAELEPAPMSKELSDFWWARVQVPKDSFELNFVLTDAKGSYENNLGQDFMFPVVDGITRERWMEILAEQARQKELERLEVERKKAEEERRLYAIKLEEEKRAREEEERKRQEELRKQDAAKGLKRAEDLGRAHYNLQRKGQLFLRQGDPQANERAAYVWVVEPREPKSGAKAKLYYNRRAACLHWLQVADSAKLKLRWGINGWQSAQVVDMQRSTKAPAAAQKQQEQLGIMHESDWWCVELDVPFEAACVDFVVNFFEHYDNNNSKDYALKIALPEGQTLESWTAALREVFRVQEFESRVAAEEEARQRELRRQERRKKAHDLVLAVERRKVRHVLFTEPEVIKAGEEVTMWYNPQDTPLNGKPQIMLMCGFNRWTHGAPLGPLAMLPPDQLATHDELGNIVTPAVVRSGSPTHWKATFVVPHDAYKMDFVFSDGQGTYDNRGGYDYHLPVDGSPVKEPSLYVVHIAVEMAPIAKVGGLGDVVTALGRAVKEQGHLVEVCLPKYEFFNYSPVLTGQLRFETEFEWGGTRVVVTTAIVENLRVWFIEPRNGFFNTQSVYGRCDDEVRFDFFCKAALEFLLRTYRQPDILHCHDWSTAHVAKAYWCDYQPYGLWKPKVVFTIHNLNYGQKKLAEAAFYCQKFTTVSPTYAFETGGNAIIYPHVHKFCGIRNGIDNEIWDPENNPFLPAPIKSEQVAQGKQAARSELRKRLNLTGWNDKFIVAVVSRLTAQKGVHLIKHTAFRTLERGGQFVLLGSAPDPKVQADFNGMATSMGGQDAALCFKYDEPLSHLIYAAADMIVVPSMFEPCGLTQMIAMRYGAVPVVRHTGGLKDTVFDVDFDKARAAWEIYGSSDWQRDGLDATNGFAFEGTDPMALDYALNRAIDAWYNDRAWFHSLQRRVMEQDWTWNRPGLDYIELYFAAIKNS